MQLSLLSHCEISLQIYWKEDQSLLEYNSTDQPVKSRLSKDVLQHAKFTNENFQLCEQLKYLTIKHGHMFTEGEDMTKRIYNELEGTNLL